MGNLIEKRWEHCGFWCETRITDLGRRCAYVFVENDHPMYEVDYRDLPDAVHELVNGGLTYSEHEGNSWILGFDFAHYWDIPDNACNIYRKRPLSMIESRLMSISDSIESDEFKGQESRIATLDIAVADCERLAEFLCQMKNSQYE